MINKTVTSESRGPCKRGLVCEQLVNDKMSWCKFSSHWCSIENEWRHCGWCMLAASWQRHATYQPSWTWQHAEGLQPGPAVEGKSVAFCQWFSMHPLLDQWHLDQKGTAGNGGRMWDICAEAIRDSLDTAEYGLSLNVKLIKSDLNQADKLTRVPQR